jgi:hypothetical protein
MIQKGTQLSNMRLLTNINALGYHQLVASRIINQTSTSEILSTHSCSNFVTLEAQTNREFLHSNGGFS